jgi:hypothetical protein
MLIRSFATGMTHHDSWLYKSLLLIHRKAWIVQSKTRLRLKDTS